MSSNLEVTVMDCTTETQAISTPSDNSKLSIGKALEEIVKRQLSGRLTIRDPNNDSIIWRVYLGKGLIHFATSIIGQQERLSYLLQRYCPPELNFSHSSEFESDYKYLCNYLQLGKLSLQQVRSLLFLVTQEAILQLLALPQAQLGFEKTVGLDPLILSVSLKQMSVVENAVQKWEQLQPEIKSPFQRFSVPDWEQLSQALQLDTDKSQRLELLSQALTQNLCLYELAYQLNRDALELATFLQPLISTGVVRVNPYRNPQNDTRPIIACIDDSKTVQRNVKLILEGAGYQVLELTEPARALTTLVRNKPVLILMDISMPEIDGYELCKMLRQSTVLKEIPIVMLTGRDGLIDRLRARMVGANDYMTKPFNPQELLNIVQKLTTVSQSEGN